MLEKIMWGFERVCGGQGYGVRIKEWIRRCHSRLCNSIWFDIKKNLVSVEGITLNYF